MGTTAEGWLGDEKAWNTKGGTVSPASQGPSFRPQRPGGAQVTVAFGQDGRKTVHRDRWSVGPGDLFPNKEPWKGFTFFKLKKQEGNQDGAGQVPRYHVGEDGPSPYVSTAHETFGPTTTSSSTSNAAAEPSITSLAAAAGPSSSTAAAASGAALRWGYRRGDAAERGPVILSQISQHPLGQRNPAVSGM